MTLYLADNQSVFNEVYKSSASTFAMNDQLKRSEVKKRRNGKGLTFFGSVGLRSAECVANRKRSYVNFLLS